MTLPVYLFIVLLAIHFASGFYPRAQNVTWKSTNFKTVLTWEPKPSANYSYTVEFSVVGRDKQRNHHCIRSSNTICDLSNSLTDLQGCYKADVLSEPPLGATSDLTEFPHTSSPQFCPYKETLFKDDRQLNIRDIFSDQLQYKVTYRRNKSTGKKVHYSKSSVIELTDLDQGESYCFNIQAYIPSRSSDKQLGKMSVIKCSNNDDQSILKVYSFPVIAVAILLILLVIGIIISVTVVCCKHRKKLLKSGREGVPLQDV
ncbi:coagulation factor III, tissue factor a isoform 2-T2 [Odontesthes bonariensis]|uniref:coagulation factor III, tissue factor a isoform X2 n=1 Tax=Odontesthes bonariensis TaxID=219752 RepID=UPI003F58CF30